VAKPKGGLTEWFGKGPKGDWVDIGAPKKKGKFQACGRKSAKSSKRKYPKCVPRAKAKSMTAAQRRSAVKRKSGNYRPTNKGAGMTKKGVRAYRKANPGSKLKTAVTGKVKKGSKAAKRRKSYCARSLGQLKRSSAKTRNDPNSRIRQARRRWKC